jgi:hypothetical protein
MTTSSPTPTSATADTSVGTVRHERGRTGRATADQVEVRLGGIGAAQAQDVFVQWGGIGATRADSVGVEFGAVGAALVGEVRVTQGFAGSVVAREATLEQTISRAVIAQRVAVNRPSAIGILIAQHVHGDVRPLLEWRGALAVGAALGIAVAIGRVASMDGEARRRRAPAFLRRR